ncbi:MAG: helix-turn-helix transcriptional regulator [Clostridia bacterium]|nr:helix-turn-helix transcriptional regulator [Clostridia bacterium]
MRKCKFGKILKELRAEKGMNQEMLAKVLNVTGATISRWESGVVEPDFQTLIFLAEMFKVSVDYILGLED